MVTNIIILHCFAFITTMIMYILAGNFYKHRLCGGHIQQDLDRKVMREEHKQSEVVTITCY